MRSKESGGLPLTPNSLPLTFLVRESERSKKSGDFDIDPHVLSRSQLLAGHFRGRERGGKENDALAVFDRVDRFEPFY